MTPERWRRITEIFHAVRERNPAQRDAFLADACAGDIALRQDVEAMLAGHDDASRFGEVLGFPPSSRLESGSWIGPYRIEGLIGAGGMGEVYHARDTKLGRDVAIKTLPRIFATDPECVARFEREARLLAALNHPNIGGILGFDDSSGAAALVLELVEGPTLADRLSTGPLTLKEALAIATQIVDALEAAHERGIVHRDLKPANIKITTEGRVKVLDFGLAKLVSIGADGSDRPNSPEGAIGKTREGVILGTTAYMSPEQTRGQVVDKRTDIWAFGCVMYEMLTGRAPFLAATIADTLAAILEREPDWDLVAQVAPAGVLQVLRRCFDKDPRRRLRDIGDARLELDAALRVGVSPNPVRGRMRRWGALSRTIALVGAALLLLAIGVGFFYTKKGPVTVLSEYQQLTNFVDSATAPSLSPDERMVTFIRGGENPLSNGPIGQVYVKLLLGGEAVRLTTTNQVKFAPTFTPDGTRIAYSQITRTGRSASWDTWTVPVLGGQPTRFLPNATGLTWIDTRRILFSEIKGTGFHMGLVTATETRADSREVYFPAHERGMVHFSSASPDGQMTLAVEMDRTTNWLPCRLLALDGHSAGRQVGPAGKCTSTAWSPDGRTMYFAAVVGGKSHLWRQKFPDGVPEQITFGPSEEEGIAMTRDGRSLVTSVGTSRDEVWIHDAEGDRRVSLEGNASLPNLSPDGRHVYYLMRRDSGAPSGELHVVDVGSGSSDNVLPGLLLTSYDVSADGQEVAFTQADTSGESQIWLAPLDRRSAPRLIARGGDKVSFGANGELIFEQLGGKENFLYRIHKDGSRRGRITSRPILNKFAVSPDGEWAVVFANQTDQGGVTGTAVRETIAVPVHGGTAKRICARFCVANWSADGRRFHVSFVEGRTLAIPVPPGKSLPDLPAEGIGTSVVAAEFPGGQVIDVHVSPGATASAYVFPRTHVQRNLYRIPLH